MTKNAGPGKWFACSRMSSKVHARYEQTKQSSQIGKARMLKIFIDTEFTDTVEPQLISVGLAAESGELFYAELQFDYMRASEFVFRHVIPLLTPETSVLSYVDFRQKLGDWLDEVRPEGEAVEICFDFDGDFTLLDYAARELPEWCRPRNVAAEVNELFRYEFFRIHKLPDHHALNDAMALRYAFEKTARGPKSFEPEPVLMKAFSHSEIGPRKNNEDSCCIVTSDNGTTLAIVADGMGGHAGGEIASGIAIQTVVTYFATGASITESAILAHKAIILEAARKNFLSGMAATLTAIAIKDSRLDGAHVGDSHAYLVRDGKVTQLTEDHSAAGFMLAQGIITEKQAKVHPERNRLDYACGMDWDDFLIQPFALELQYGDRILLSTDGLHDKLLLSEIAEAAKKEPCLEQFCKRLVALARARRLSDNATLVGLEYSDHTRSAAIPSGIKEGVCICIGCGVDDEDSSSDGNTWVRKDKEIAAGVCSNCTGHTNRWDRARHWPN